MGGVREQELICRKANYQQLGPNPSHPAVQQPVSPPVLDHHVSGGVGAGGSGQQCMVSQQVAGGLQGHPWGVSLGPPGWVEGVGLQGGLGVG